MVLLKTNTETLSLKRSAPGPKPREARTRSIYPSRRNSLVLRTLPAHSPELTPGDRQEVRGDQVLVLRVSGFVGFWVSFAFRVHRLGLI